MDGVAAVWDKTDPHLQPAGVVLAALGTDAQRGLSQAEASGRLARHGRNELTAKAPVPAWRKALAQFQNVLVVLLVLAALMSAALWLADGTAALPYEAMTILAVVLLNALMGYAQQARAEQAVAALRRMSAPQAGVVRDGVRRRVAAADLVPGDLILIEEGDTVSADARVTHSAMLHMAEAALTGESLPVPKDAAALPSGAGLGDRGNMVFSGTFATGGHGQAVVTATGMGTEVGRIAALLEATEEEATPLQRQLDRVGWLLGAGVVAIAAVMVGTILAIQGAPDLRSVLHVLILGVALAVAGVPEGLPAVVTAVLALGVQRLARRHAIVRHLAAVETLGSATVIASDKTGTLTRNEMTVRRVVTASGGVDVDGTGYGPDGGVRREGREGREAAGPLRAEVVQALTSAACVNNAFLHERAGRWTVQGDPTEGALLVAAGKAGLDLQALGRRFPRLSEVPFSSARKLMSTIHADVGRPGGQVLFTKGAPDVLLGRCTHEQVGDEAMPFLEERRAAVLAANDALAGGALRTLGVACRRLPDGAGFDLQAGAAAERDLVFLGLIGMMDPPREEAREAVAQAQGAGIRPVMMTGDHPVTAAAIASELGIATDGRTVTGTELEAMPDGVLDRTVCEVSVYARVNPEHKLRIVRALQRGGAVVAMTGDGVNDAPALKAADIGVAMGITGTDVSKEAADIVLADDNFATIVAAVEEGRAVFANIRKFLRYLLSSNIGEVMTMFFGVVLADTVGLAAQGGGGVALPLLATQLLWINLVTDGAPALALGVDPVDAGTMREPPRRHRDGVITRRMWAGILFAGAVMAAGTLLVLDASLPGGLIEGSGDMAYARTMAFTTLVMFQLFNVLNARSDERSAFSGLFRNRWLWIAVGLSSLLQAAAVHVPFLQRAFSTVGLGFADWLACIAVGSTVLWLCELGKLASRRLARRTGPDAMA